MLTNFENEDLVGHLKCLGELIYHEKAQHFAKS